MDKYLLQILLETKTIIIPGLGALTITNEETGEIMFMSYLKYDDGTLVKHISEKEHISENDAQNLIAKYVTVIENKLTQGDEYEMFEFGKFFMKDGEIEFQNWRSADTESISDSSEKVEEVEAPVEKVIEVVEIVEVITPLEEEVVIHESDKSLDQILSETKESEPEIKEVPKTKKEKKEKVTKAVKENTYTPPVKETVIVVETQSIPDDVVVEKTIEIDPALNDENAELKKVVLVKKKRKPFFWVLIVLIVLLLAMATMTIFFYDQVKHYFPFMESQRTEVERNKVNAEEFSEDLNESAEIYEQNGNADENQVDGTAVEEPAAETEVVNTEKTAPVAEATVVNNNASTGNNYFVIGGAFEMKENADRYVAKLIADGNQSSLVGPYGNVYMVAIASFNSEAEAMNELDKLRGISSNAWIFHKR